MAYCQVLDNFLQQLNGPAYRFGRYLPFLPVITNRLRFFIGAFLAVNGSIIMAYFWGTGSSLTGGGDFWIPSCFAQIIGASIALRATNIKVLEPGLFGPIYFIIIGILLSLFSYLYLKPTILSDGIKTSAIVTEIYIEEDNIVGAYEYSVDGRYYRMKREIGIKEKGEYLEIAYLEWRPEYHLVIGRENGR